jgi:hypothetical protein
VRLVRTDVLEERVASIFIVERISGPVAANVDPSSLIISTLKMETTRSSETSVITTHTAPQPKRRNSS